MRPFEHPWGWTSLAPILCAVHCMVTPVLIVSAPAFALGETIEWGLLGASVVLGGFAMASGLRTHESLLPALLALFGVLAWTGSLLYLYRPIPEEATTIAAALTVAGALVWNSRLHCASKAVHCSACAHGELVVAPDERPGAAPEPG